MGIFLIILGLFLLPFGWILIKERYEDIKDLNLKEKVVAIIFEIVDILTIPIFSAWLIILSILMIIGGILMLLL